MTASRVAFVVPGPLDQRTGGYLYDRAIVDGLAAGGRRVDVVELPGRFPEADATATAAATASLDRLAASRVRVIDGLALPAYARVVERLPRPWVALVHHPLALETGLSRSEAERLRSLEARLLAFPDRVVVTGPRTVRDLAALGVDPARVAVVTPGVEPPAAARGPLPGRPERLLAVASVTPRKGFPVLIDALGRVADLPWTLRVAGSTERDPDAFRAAAARADAAGLAPRIAFLGELAPAALAREYAAAHLFVLASYHEGYGMAFAEALTHGLPVVATAAGAVPDTVPPGAGLLVAPGDPGALADALRAVMTDPRRYGGLAAGARAGGEALPRWPDSVGAFAVELDRTAAGAAA